MWDNGLRQWMNNEIKGWPIKLEWLASTCKALNVRKCWQWKKQCSSNSSGTTRESTQLREGTDSLPKIFETEVEEKFYLEQTCNLFIGYISLLTVGKNGSCK